MIPLGPPELVSDDWRDMERVLSSGQLVQGTEVEAFERELTDTTGVDHAVVVNSGTAALVLGLKAIGVEPGDTVMVPAYSWIATANAVAMLGAAPAFVDVDPSTYAMDCSALEAEIVRHLSSGARVRAIVVVHPFGFIPPMRDYSEVAERHGVALVEDAACALGARDGVRMAGSIGTIGIYSFHPRKVITTGEGGALVTNDAAHAEFVRNYRNHGQSLQSGRREFVAVGDNRRLTDFQAALGRAQLARLDAILRGRRDVIEAYRAELDGQHLRFQAYERERTAAQAAVAVVPSHIDRDRVIARLAALGTQASIGTIDMTSASQFARHRPCPVTARVARGSISLPLHSKMTSRDIDTVISSVRVALSEQ